MPHICQLKERFDQKQMRVILPVDTFEAGSMPANSVLKMNEKGTISKFI